MKMPKLENKCYPSIGNSIYLQSELTSVNQSFDSLIKQQPTNHSTESRDQVYEKIQNQNNNRSQNGYSMLYERVKQSINKFIAQTRNKLKAQLRDDQNKSSITLLWLSFKNVILCKTFFYFKRQNIQKLDVIQLDLKKTQNRINYYHKQDTNQKDLNNDCILLFYGEVVNDTCINMEDISQSNNSLNIQIQGQKYQLIHQSPYLKTDHSVQDNAVALPFNRGLYSKFYSSVLFLPAISKFIEIKLESDNLSSLQNGEFVYIIGQKLSDLKIKPITIFRHFSFARYDILIRIVKTKAFVHGIIGSYLLYLAIRNVYSFCKKRKYF